MYDFWSNSESLNLVPANSMKVSGNIWHIWKVAVIVGGGGGGGGGGELNSLMIL